MDEFNPAKSVWLPRLSILILLHASWVSFGLVPSQADNSFLMSAQFWLLLLPALLYPPVMATWLAIFRRRGNASLVQFFRRPANFVSYSRPFFIMTGVVLGSLLIAWPQGGTGIRAFAGNRLPWNIISSLLVALGFAGDFLDGFLARRENPDSLRRRGTPEEARQVGPWLDAESDSLAVYFTVAAMVGLSIAPGFMLLPAVARYAYALPSVFIPPRLSYPVWFKWYSKSAAASLQTLVAAYWISAVFGLDSDAPVFTGIALAVCSAIALSFAISLWFRVVTAFRLLQTKGSGILRSWIVYYIVPFVLFPFRFRRMTKLYASFISPGDLVYDVGSHLGNRIAVFLHLGARVRAFEPQQACIAPLNEWYGAEKQVTLRFAGLGEKKGAVPIYRSVAHPTLTSLDPDWVSRRGEEDAFSKIQWDRGSTVEMSTLDDEIRESGMPAFTKIDVEGFETRVLRGNSHALPALSFEFLPSDVDAVLQCIDEVCRLGNYQFNYSPGESMKFEWQTWIDADALKTFLSEYPLGSRSGDVYARRR